MAKTKYGKLWSDKTSDVQIELWMYRNANDVETRFKHFKAACRMLFPDKLNGSICHYWSHWTERRAKAWCGYRYITWLGPSASGKSTDAAAFALVDFLASPTTTSTRIASTTKDALQDRMWSEVVRLWSMYPEGTFEGCNFVPSDMEITCGAKGRIKGIAVKEGSIQQGINSLIGVHSGHSRIIADELQGMPMAIMDATRNASAGCETFIFCGMGNPDSRMNPLGVYSEPKAGWGAATTEVESWETKWGVCLYFDGLKSPGVTEPETYGKFLLNQQQIDEVRQNDGEDSLSWWSQRRGFFPPEGLTNAIVDEPTIIQYKMMDKSRWSGNYTTGIACDPAYSSGGDRCMVQPFAVGEIEDGTNAIVYFPQIQINLVVRQDMPMSDLIGVRLGEIAKDFDVKANHIAIDCSGPQGAIADKVEEYVGKGVLRIQFSGRHGSAQMDTISDQLINQGKRVWYNKRAEMYCAMRVFGRAGQVRGLSPDSVSDIIQVRYSRISHPILAEYKEDVKKRIGRSPDAGDAAVMALDCARYRMMLRPKRTELVNGKEKESLDEMYRRYDYDGHEDTYLTHW
jgi:hypothetical protein